MNSSLYPRESVFDPNRRFAFTNILDVEFRSAWNSSPIVVQPHQTVELPHHLAAKLTGELVDSIMIAQAKQDEMEAGKGKFDPFVRSVKGLSLGIPQSRKFWEDKIVRELAVDEESPEIQVMRAKLKDEIMQDIARNASKQPAVEPSLNVGMESFNEVNAVKGKAQELTKPKRGRPPMKLKEIKGTVPEKPIKEFEEIATQS